MTMIKVTINTEKNRISVWNNGKGIPVVMHTKEKVWVPELIFGHLLTSSNYNDNVKKVTGGRNGFGAKLTASRLEADDSLREAGEKGAKLRITS